MILRYTVRFCRRQRCANIADKEENLLAGEDYNGGPNSGVDIIQFESLVSAFRERNERVGPAEGITDIGIPRPYINYMHEPLRKELEIIKLQR